MATAVLRSLTHETLCDRTRTYEPSYQPPPTYPHPNTKSVHFKPFLLLFCLRQKRRDGKIFLVSLVSVYSFDFFYLRTEFTFNFDFCDRPAISAGAADPSQCRCDGCGHLARLLSPSGRLLSLSSCRALGDLHRFYPRSVRRFLRHCPTFTR